MAASWKSGALGMGGCRRRVLLFAFASIQIHRNDEDLRARDPLERPDDIMGKQSAQFAVAHAIGQGEWRNVDFEPFDVMNSDHSFSGQKPRRLDDGAERAAEITKEAVALLPTHSPALGAFKQQLNILKKQITHPSGGAANLEPNTNTAND